MIYFHSIDYTFCSLISLLSFSLPPPQLPTTFNNSSLPPVWNRNERYDIKCSHSQKHQNNERKTKEDRHERDLIGPMTLLLLDILPLFPILYSYLIHFQLSKHCACVLDLLLHFLYTPEMKVIFGSSCVASVQSKCHNYVFMSDQMREGDNRRQTQTIKA